MSNIQMVDLKGQYAKIKPQVDEAIYRVINSAAFVKGPEVKQFQQELSDYLGIKHVVACGNGTDALQVALMSLGLKPGDEVITSNFTFIATVEVIALLGLVPVLVDVEPDTFNIDVKKLQKAVTPKTKAIIPVHLFGQCSNMEAIMSLAEQKGLYVVEDNAQAIGADYTFSSGETKKAGTIGHIGCTSFFPSKNLGCYGDGGAIFTNDDNIAKSISSIVNHGMEVRYHHDRIGVNSRLDSIQAAILRIKLPKLDDYCRARYSAADYYNKAFEKIEGLVTPVVSGFTSHVYHQYTLRVKYGKRDELKEWLNNKSIPSMVYYPIPLNKQKAFVNWYDDNIQYPVTEELCNEVISLPMHTELADLQLKEIVEAVISFFNK